MSAYLAQCEDLDREETRRLSDKVKAHARLTLETLDQVRRKILTLNIYPSLLPPPGDIRDARHG